MTELRLGVQDAGRTVEVAASARLVVALEEMAGGGYTWEVESLPPGARVVEERYEQPPGAGIGAASQHVFVIDAATGGELRLVHRRPWEGEDGVLDRFAITATPASGR